MQHQTGQPNDNPCLYRTHTRTGRSRWTAPSWHWSRQPCAISPLNGPANTRDLAWPHKISGFKARAPGPEFFRPETKPKFRPVSPARDQISKIVRRTGRANAAHSRKVSVIRDLGDCVVADAVQVEPVSTAEFPANREKNREFCRNGMSGASATVNNGVVIGLSTRIPYSTEQGIILAEQGKLGARTGNFVGQN